MRTMQERHEKPTSMRIVREPGGGVHVHAFGHKVWLPQNRLIRLSLALGLLVGSLFAILPVFGLWMLPLGLLVLSVDYPPAERLARKIVAWALHLRRRLFRRGPGTS